MDKKIYKKGRYRDQLIQCAENFYSVKLIISSNQEFIGIILSANYDFITLLDTNYKLISIPMDKITCFQIINSKNNKTPKNKNKDLEKNNKDIISPNLRYKKTKDKRRNVVNFCGNTSNILKEDYFEMIK